MLLGFEDIGIHDDFFELGGDSLLAIRVLNLLHESFGVEYSLASLLRAATIELLAAKVEPGWQRRSPLLGAPQPLPRLASSPYDRDRVAGTASRIGHRVPRRRRVIRCRGPLESLTPTCALFSPSGNPICLRCWKARNPPLYRSPSRKKDCGLRSNSIPPPANSTFRWRCG